MSLMICTPQKTNRQSAPGELARRLGYTKTALEGKFLFEFKWHCLVDATQGFILKQKVSLFLNKKHHSDTVT